MQGARQVQHGAQLGQASAQAGCGGCGFGRGHLLHQAPQFRAIHHEQELVGILRAEIDAVGVPQRLPFGALPVDENSVAAAGVFDHVAAVFEHDARVRPRDPAVSQDQVALRLAADQERQWVDGNSRAMAAGIGDDQRCGFGRGRSGGGFHLLRPGVGAPRPRTAGLDLRRSFRFLAHRFNFARP